MRNSENSYPALFYEIYMKAERRRFQKTMLD